MCSFAVEETVAIKWPCYNARLQILTFFLKSCVTAIYVRILQCWFVVLVAYCDQNTIGALRFVENSRHTAK